MAQAIEKTVTTIPARLSRFTDLPLSAPIMRSSRVLMRRKYPITPNISRVAPTGSLLEYSQMKAFPDAVSRAGRAFRR